MKMHHASNFSHAMDDIKRKKNKEISITRHGKPVMVLLSRDEYDRLKAIEEQSKNKTEKNK